MAFPLDTGIAGYFIKAIGGIRPDPAADGMKKFIIRPNLSLIPAQ